MKRSSSKRSGSGLALVELLMTVLVLSIVVSSLCEVFFAVNDGWQRQQGEQDVLIATSLACSKVGDYISRSIQAAQVSRFSSGDTLALSLPADKTYGIYIPKWSGGTLAYRVGTYIVFYLSDSTGSYSHTGNILWAATFTNWNDIVHTVTPDASWSLYYGRAGRITPIQSMSFSVDTTGEYPKVTMTVGSTYKIGRTQKNVSQSKTTCVRDSKA